MIKVHNIHIGSRDDLAKLDESWAFVHACKTSHQKRLGYTRPPVHQPYYIQFRDRNHLYLNWVDAPSGKFFKVETVVSALDFIDEYVNERDVFVHCDMGHSRSPSLALVYLAKRTDYLEDNFKKAVEKFAQVYPHYQPSGIFKFLEANWDNIK